MKLTSYGKVILALTVVALCGGAMGASVALRIQNQRLARQAGGALADESSAERLATYLRLESVQMGKIRPVLERGQMELRTIATNAIAQTVQARKRLEEEVWPLLTPEQRNRLLQLIERRERARERWQSGERALPGTPEQRERLRERIEQRWRTQTNQAPAARRPN